MSYDVSKVVEKILTEKKLSFFRTLKPQRVSFRELCSGWEWARRSDVYTHLLHRYPAKLLPYIPIFFLSSPTYAYEDDVVLDPFAGTGTVLLESIVHQTYKRNSIGVEINPLARLIAKVKTTPLDVNGLYEKSIELTNKIKSYRGEIEIPSFSNMDIWFSKNVQSELAKIRNCIEEIEEENFKDFFWTCFSSIIRHVSFADPHIAPPVLLKLEKFPKERREKIRQMIKRKKVAKPILYFKTAIEKNIERVKRLNNVPEVATGKIKSEIVWDDARDLKLGKIKSKGMLDKSNAKPIKKGSIGIAITSPPYINAQKYVRTTKFELLWLGLLDECGLIKLDREMIGTERIYENEYKDQIFTELPSADNVIENIYKKNPKRAAIVSKYFIDMRLAMKEIYRVLKEGGRFILVVGNNKVCGEIVENHNILSEIAAEQIGFKLEMILVDEIRSRGMITKRHETGGLISDEWVVVLRKEG